MAYATTDAFIRKIGLTTAIGLTNREDPAADTVDLDVLQQSLDDVSAQMDSYLSGRYALPLATVPAAFEGYCISLAYCDLALDGCGETQQEKCKQIIAWLEAVAKGKIGLGLPADDTPASSGQPQYTTPSRVFSPTNLELY
jgi:phage gp36-like protein